MRLGASTGMVFMTRRRYDALPAPARRILDENSGEAASRTLGAAWDEAADGARQSAEADPKQQVVYPTAEAPARWKTITAPVSAEWIKNTPGGEKVLAAFGAYLAQIRRANRSLAEKLWGVYPQIGHVRYAHTCLQAKPVDLRLVPHAVTACSAKARGGDATIYQGPVEGWRGRLCARAACRPSQ